MYILNANAKSTCLWLQVILASILLEMAESHLRYSNAFEVVTGFVHISKQLLIAFIWSFLVVEKLTILRWSMTDVEKRCPFTECRCSLTESQKQILSTKILLVKMFRLFTYFSWRILTLLTIFTDRPHFQTKTSNAQNTCSSTTYHHIKW